MEAVKRTVQGPRADAQSSFSSESCVQRGAAVAMLRDGPQGYSNTRGMYTGKIESSLVAGGRDLVFTAGWWLGTRLQLRRRRFAGSKALIGCVDLRLLATWRRGMDFFVVAHS